MCVCVLSHKCSQVLPESQECLFWEQMLNHSCDSTLTIFTTRGSVGKTASQPLLHTHKHTQIHTYTLSLSHTHTHLHKLTHQGTTQTITLANTSHTYTPQASFRTHYTHTHTRKSCRLSNFVWKHMMSIGLSVPVCPHWGSMGPDDAS